MSKLSKKAMQVAVILEVANKSTRDMLAGIVDYSRLYGPWVLHIIEGQHGGQKLLQFNRWKGSGIIGLIQSHDIAEYIVNANLPTVIIDPEDDFQPPHPVSKFCTVYCDTSAVGKMAAEYLLELNFEHYAFVGEVHDVYWSHHRGIAFQKRIQEAGKSFYHYDPLPKNVARDWALEQKKMCQWLKSLPKPVGILAAMDARGLHVLEACMVAGISVPHEVAVLSVDNDELLCESTFPPMSSIQMDGKEVFFYAAQLLDNLMKRKIRKKRVLTYGPKCVVSRRSTDSVSSVDKIVSQALDYIWINSGKSINIDVIARSLDISRRTLEIRFKEKVGSTIHEEISRARLERVKALLQTTDMTITEIAALCGYNECGYLGAIFKEKFGITMTQYKKQIHMEASNSNGKRHLSLNSNKMPK